MTNSMYPPYYEWRRVYKSRFLKRKYLKIFLTKIHNFWSLKIFFKIKISWKDSPLKIYNSLKIFKIIHFFIKIYGFKKYCTAHYIIPSCTALRYDIPFNITQVQKSANNKNVRGGGLHAYVPAILYHTIQHYVIKYYITLYYNLL